MFNGKKIENKREETSKWIEKEFEDNDEHKETLSNDIQVGTNVKVRILPTTLTLIDFVCQRLDLLKSYDKLQSSMNEHYEKLKNASRSLEVGDSRFSKVSTFAFDSMNSINSECEFFHTKFSENEYCAVQFDNSWKRCKIIEIRGTQCLVESVDDFSFKQVKINKLEKLSQCFMSMPKLALKCKFANYGAMKLLAMNQQIKEEFMRFLITNILVAEISNINDEDPNSKTYDVILYANDKNVLENLEIHGNIAKN